MNNFSTFSLAEIFAELLCERVKYGSCTLAENGSTLIAFSQQARTINPKAECQTQTLTVNHSKYSFQNMSVS